MWQRKSMRRVIGALLCVACSDGSGATTGVDADVAEDAGSDVTAPGDSSTTDAAPVDGAAGCITDTTAGDHQFTCDGFVYDVSVPTACAGGGCGLVLDVHGATMSGKMEDANTQMRALGATNGFVVVQPNAKPAPPLSSWTPATDDDKVFAFLGLATAAWKIDPKRVHMTGFSQGGMMTFRFLCKHADVFASMAPAAGDGCTFAAGDTPSRELPVLYMHGTKDNLVNFTSGAIPQRNEVVSGWKMDAGTVIGSDSNYSRTRYTSPMGTVFEFIQHDYAATSPILGGHCYPGSTDPGGATGQLFPFACVGPNAFTWGDEAMKFFLAHPKS
jgi:polyhydroxybutyrate depolymerase